jgi:hypothetical protein
MGGLGLRSSLCCTGALNVTCLCGALGFSQCLCPLQLDKCPKSGCMLAAADDLMVCPAHRPAWHGGSEVTDVCLMLQMHDTASKIWTIFGYLLYSMLISGCV